MTERRYSEAEIAEILEAATREARSLPAPGAETRDPEGGLTLSQLRDIAREVGIDPEAVSRGAAAMEVRRSSVEQVRRLSGVPIGVSRSASLGRPMTEEEWGRFVAVLRQTFDAPGKLSMQAGLWEWRNGNLSVAHFPEEEGARLALRTRRQGWESLPVIGGMTTGMSLVVALAGVMKGDVSSTLPGAVALLAMGSATWTYGFFALRNWARERMLQFRGLVDQASAVTSAGALPPGEEEPDREG